ncbi:aldehyde dehydrogenase family protein [Nocardia coubleae]|uniref:Aldehyde dehydrogenase family protein n=1 Tax=Nocardia coubleae TaxID=356147 RepID=A0A846W1D4_9NOCA|nr:aldehyde dehydrogenase family protein [Nocardia coubleae]NKX86835.1 aldehyde dehydrogenase family protein [Nocardia coubleae]
MPNHVEQLRAAQREWEQSGVAARIHWLRRYAEWLLDNQDTIVAQLASEVGKPLIEAQIEFMVPIELINYLTGTTVRCLDAERVTPANLLGALKTATVTHRPYPVVAVITPWNFPLGLSLCDAIPALLAGAAVVVKPAPATPGSVITAVSGWGDIGAPPVFSVLAGDDTIGRALVDEVDYVQFTGSSRTGRAIAQRCGQRLIPCGLELGGKDPALVLADADLDHAARGIAWGALANAGQMCTSIERVFVEKPVFEQFVAKLAAHVDSLQEGRDLSALVTADQFDIVVEHLDQAVAAGASVVSGGGHDRSRRWVQPTVLIDVDPSMACMREETFGPLIPVLAVADEDEAVRLANDSDYGLSASVWSSDRARAERIAARLEAGAVNINDSHANVFLLSAPMHGWKQSGLAGRFGGRDAVLKYCRPQAVTAARIPLSYQRHLLWFPYSTAATAVLGRTLRVLAARGTRRWTW